MTLAELTDRLDDSVGAGATPATLRNQLASLREQAQAVDARIQELEARIEQYETHPQFKEIRGDQDALKPDAKKFLKLLFESPDGSMALEYIAQALGLPMGMTQYHFEKLDKRGLVELFGVTPGGALVGLTDAGREYVVENLN